jgi:hypothetical protein
MSLIPNRWRQWDPETRRAKSREAAELIVTTSFLGCAGLMFVAAILSYGSVWMFML